MVGQLDDLDEPAALERPADDEPRGGEPLAVEVVHLVAVAVALEDDPLAVQLTCARVLGELDSLGAEPHRPAEILDPLLLGQQVDDGERRLRVHLRRVRSVEPDEVPRELGDGDEHAEPEPEIRDALLAPNTAREDLPLPAARAEAARD